MKSLLVLLALTVSVTAMARDDRDNGRFTKNDGGTIVRIEVGNDRNTDTRHMMRRMVQLEKAVRELQNRVYDLEDDARPVNKEVRVYICEVVSDFSKTFLGQPALTELEAKSSARQACQRENNAVFCKGTPSCDSRIEVQKN